MPAEWYTERTVRSCTDLFDEFQKYLAKEVGEWIFRGHSKASWPLETAIERLRKRFDSQWQDLPGYEEALLREFRRRAHIYYSTPPKEDSHVEWLALLRHHGGPTRLLDFSYSPFVAAYFALEGADSDCAVWAINNLELRRASKRIVTTKLPDGEEVWNRFRKSREGCDFGKMFWRAPPLRFVSSANPMRLNERLTLQQGLFLCPADITVPFEKNLRATSAKLQVIKIVIKHTIKGRAEMLALLRKMNIDSTTLFPGLDGFARSLNTRFEEIGELGSQAAKQSG